MAQHDRKHKAAEMGQMVEGTVLPGMVPSDITYRPSLPAQSAGLGDKQVASMIGKRM